MTQDIQLIEECFVGLEFETDPTLKQFNSEQFSDGFIPILIFIAIYYSLLVYGG